MKKSTTSTLEQQVDSITSDLIKTSDEKHTKYFDHVRKMAYTYAQSRLPRLDDNLIGYVEEIIAFYERERTSVLLALASSIQNMLTKIGISEPIKQIAEKEREINNHVRVLNNKKEDKNHIKVQRDIWLHKVYNVILWIITFLECFFFAFVFSGIFNDTNIMVILGAFVLSFSLIQAVKIFTLYVRDKKEKLSLWIKIVAPVAIISTIISLGLIRYASVSVSSDETIIIYRYLNNPIVFSILSAIPLIATALIVYKYHLSEDEIKQLRQREQLDNECKEQEKHISNCRSELKDLTAHRNDVANAGVKREHAERILALRYDAYLKESISLFKIENTKHRDDSVFPICFTQPSPTLAPIHHNQFNNQENQLS